MIAASGHVTVTLVTLISSRTPVERQMNRSRILVVTTAEQVI